MTSRGLVLSGDSQYGFVSIVKLTSGTSSCRLPKNHPIVMTGFCRANTDVHQVACIKSNKLGTYITWICTTSNVLQIALAQTQLLCADM